MCTSFLICILILIPVLFFGTSEFVPALFFSARGIFGPRILWKAPAG